ncbi:MAG: YigZ family protein [Firmicutes bacterium]|nr:YigZ family protein [Bacillota bacterium]
MNDSLITVARNVRVKIPVGACRFIASVARTDTEEEAKAFIAQVAKEFHDATHNAYAYKIGLGDMAITRQSDDAEPAGTAGPPMLQTIEHAGLTNVTIVGTRYFGGVKLGIGGLIRAYRACAEAGLKEAGRKKEIFKFKLQIRVPYEWLGTVLKDIPSFRGKVVDVEYEAKGVNVICLVPVSAREALIAQITENTRGKAEILGHTKKDILQGGDGAD